MRVKFCVMEGRQGCCCYVRKVPCGAGPSRGQADLSLWWTGQAPPSWGGQRGQGHDHSPVQRTSVLPVFTVGHVDATCTVTMCEGNPQAPRLPWARSCRHPQAGLLVAWGP